MNLLLAAAAVLVLALAGAGALRFFWPAIREIPRTARLALGYCTGTFLLTAIFFCAYMAGLSFSRPLIVVPISILAIVGLSYEARSRLSVGKVDLTISLALLLAALAVVLSWARPVYGYDALSMWALKAKLAFYAKTWPATMFDPYTTHHPEYPPLVPSAQAFVFFWFNAFDDVASRTVFAAFFATGAAILWWLLGTLRVSMRGLWLLWWCALPLMMDQVKITYADLPLAVFLFVFFGAVVSWLREPARTDWMKLAGVFAGLAFWVKQDALIGVAAGFLALFFVAHRRRLPVRPVIMAAVITLVLAAPWRLLVWWKKLPSDFSWPSGDLLSKAGLITRELFNYAFIEGNYAFFWPMFVLVVLCCAKRLLRTENLWLASVMVAGLAGIFAVYLFSRVDLAAQLRTSADRVLVSLFVPALLLLALLWRASFAVLRPHRWQVWVAAVALAVAAGQFVVGLNRKSDIELVGFSISPFPVALTWVWIVVIALTILKYVGRLRRGALVVWRAAQYAIVVATLGLSLVAIGIHAREAGELRRLCGGKSLAAQHAAQIDPALAQKIEDAVVNFPEGTRVRLRPKRSLSYHIFYYEAYPRLIVDDSAPNLIELDAHATE